MTRHDDQLSEALANWLTIEHEAVWTYPIISARVDSRTGSAAAAYRRHERIVRRLERHLETLGVEAPAPQVSYDIGRLTSAQHADRRARSVEDRATAAALATIGASEGPMRRWALRMMGLSAEARVHWNGEPEALPGIRT